MFIHISMSFYWKVGEIKPVTVSATITNREEDSHSNNNSNNNNRRRREQLNRGVVVVVKGAAAVAAVAAAAAAAAAAVVYTLKLIFNYVFDFVHKLHHIHYWSLHNIVKGVYQ